MHINLDNICFYSHPPTKSSSRSLPTSSWRAYNPPVVPQTFPHTLSPRLHSPRTGVDVFPQCQAPATVQTDSCTGSEFDIEIQRSMTQIDPISAETGLERDLNPGLQGQCPIDVPPRDQTSFVGGTLATSEPRSAAVANIVYPSYHSDDFTSGDTLIDLDMPLENTYPQFCRPSPPLSPNGLPVWHRDSIPSLEPSNETDNGPLSPEGSLVCPRIFSTPLPNLSVHPSIETSIQDVSVVDDTEREETSVDRTRSPENEVAAASAPVNVPSMTESMSEGDAIGRLTEDRHVSVLSCSASQTRSTSHSQDILVKPPSPRLRRSVRSAQRQQYPAVSVVIPTHRNDELVAKTRKNRPTASKRYRRRGSSGHDRETRKPIDDDYSPHSERNSMAGCRSSKRPKRAKGNRLPSNSAVRKKCANKPRETSEGGMAFTFGKTEEIFGRGVLRVQANGPRYAYFMTFLPEVSRHPSTPSEISCRQTSRDESHPENTTRRRVGCRKRCTRSISTIYEERDRVPTEMLRSSLSCRSDNESQKKPTRRLRWTSKEIDYLKGLRRDRQRPWSEVTRLFLDRYPGRSPAAIQVYCSTHGL